MKSYDELKAEMEAIQRQMVEVKKNERAKPSTADMVKQRRIRTA